MAKDKSKPSVPNKHLHTRIAYLQQAATYLTLHGQGKPVEALTFDPRIHLSSTIRNSRPEAGTHSNDGDLAEKPSHDVDKVTVASAGANGNALLPQKQVYDAPVSGGLPLHLATHMRQVAQKSQIRLHTSIKHTICKCCSAVLIEGQTCRKYVENLSRDGKKAHADVLVLQCGVCGVKKRFPVGAKRQKRKSERRQRDGKDDATQSGAEEGQDAGEGAAAGD